MMVAERPRLESWKEVARFLEVSVRTAQLWEHERGLPVRRLPGAKRSRVFAFQDEIQAWLEHDPVGLTNSRRNDEPVRRERRDRDLRPPLEFR